MAFRFANGALQATATKLGANVKNRRIVHDVGSEDIFLANGVQVNGALQVGSTWFVSGAISAEPATTLGVGTVTKIPKLADGALVSGRATLVGFGAQLVEGEGSLISGRATAQGQVKLFFEAAGALNSTLVTLKSTGIVARQLRKGDGALFSGPSTVEGAGDRGVEGADSLISGPASVSAQATLERLVRWEARGHLLSSPATVQADANRIVIGFGDLICQRASVYGNNYVPSFADPTPVSYTVRPRDILKMGWGVAPLLVKTPPRMRVGRLDYSFTIEPMPEIEPMPDQSATPATEAIIFEIADPQHVFYVPRQATLLPGRPLGDYAVDPVNHTWQPEIKAA